MCINSSIKYFYLFFYLTFQIRNTQKDDSGVYECQGKSHYLFIIKHKNMNFLACKMAWIITWISIGFCDFSYFWIYRTVFIINCQFMRNIWMFGLSACTNRRWPFGLPLITSFPLPCFCSSKCHISATDKLSHISYCIPSFILPILSTVIIIPTIFLLICLSSTICIPTLRK